jgi:hypothetical protein
MNLESTSSRSDVFRPILTHRKTKNNWREDTDEPYEESPLSALTNTKNQSHNSELVESNYVPIKMESDEPVTSSSESMPLVMRPILDEDGYPNERAINSRRWQTTSMRGLSVGPIMNQQSLSGVSDEENDSLLMEEQEETVHQVEQNMTPDEIKRVHKRDRLMRHNRTCSLDRANPEPDDEDDHESLEYMTVLDEREWEYNRDSEDVPSEHEHASEQPQEQTPKPKWRTAWVEEIKDKDGYQSHQHHSIIDPEDERTTWSQSLQAKMVDNILDNHLSNNSKNKRPGKLAKTTRSLNTQKVSQPSNQIPQNSMLGQMMRDITRDEPPSDGSDSSDSESSHNSKKASGGWGPRKLNSNPDPEPSDGESHDDGNGHRGGRTHRTPTLSDDGGNNETTSKSSKNRKQSHYKEWVKPIKPNVYDGWADLHAFTLYIHQVMDYIHTGKVTEQCKVIIAGRFTSGAASRYYISQVAATTEDWTVHEFFSGLFNEIFQQNYCTVIQHQINLMAQKGKRVWHYATDLAAKYALLPEETDRAKVLKLWDDLQLRIRIELIKKGYSPEITDWKTIIDEAKKIQMADDEISWVLQQDKEWLRAAQAMVAEEERQTYQHNKQAMNRVNNHTMERNKYNNIPRRNCDYSSKPHWQSFNDYARGQWEMEQKDGGPRLMRVPAYTPSDLSARL